MKALLLSVAAAAAFIPCHAVKNKTYMKYRDSAVPVAERVEDLLSRMTLDEKIGQMNQYVGVEHLKANMGSLSEEDLFNNTAQAIYPGFSPKDLEDLTMKGLVGSFLHVITLKEANYLQSLAMQSRLQIPVIFGIDAIHGNANCPDNTVYPTNLGLACSFDTDMAYKIGRQTAAEMRAMNMHWTFNPNVEVARDPRWGRCGETFGEDPYLVTKLGIATVNGYQGKLNGANDVLACIKHFVGGSQPANGTNGSPTDVSERTLREVFFPPFKAGVDAGAMSLMTSHNELNGIPCHENDWLMNDVLRGEWGFKGFVVSDWMDIEHIYDLHATAPSLKEAFYQSIMAGMDMHMHGIHWNEYVGELVREGRILESRIDQSVRRILYLKFKLGLFEKPYADEQTSMDVRLCPEHRATALEAARNSIVLLKNDGILPLSQGKYKKILVTGINANDENILGDWSAQQKPENVTTVLEGIRIFAGDSQVEFVDQGWDPRNMDPKKVDAAVKAAKKADLNIVVAGEYMMRYRWTERTGGEDTDRSDIDLVGLQNELIRKVAASGKPTILILINGRPLGVEWAAENIPAIVEAWEPGMTGGTAIAEILYGKVNPSAKLAITIPRSVGQIQMTYNHKPSMYFHPYAVTSSEPLYPFGFGLSYTTYKYGNLRLSAKEIGANGTVDVSVDITNTGDRDGVEIAQLYIRDVFSSVTRPVKELKDFARVALKAGETKTVKFTITSDKLRFLDRKMKSVVEAGEFKVMVGSSSRDEDLLTDSFNVVKPTDRLESRLRKVVGLRKFIIGQHDAIAYGHNWTSDYSGREIRSDVKDVCGDLPGLLNWDLGLVEWQSDKELDGVPFDFIRKEVVNHDRRGGINAFSWHPRNPATKGNSWVCKGGNVVRECVTEGTALNDTMRLWLRRAAEFIGSLRDSDGRRIPVVFRPWHEHTGSWFWWGRDNCSADDYKALWRLTRSVFDEEGIDNVMWAYSPDKIKSADDYFERYPGDEYVDILGADAYHFDGDKGLDEYLKRVDLLLGTAAAYAKKSGQIVVFSETGSEGLPMPKWWTEVLMKAIGNQPVAYVCMWRNASDNPKHFYMPYPGQKSAADFVDFYKNPRTVFCKDLEQIK